MPCQPLLLIVSSKRNPPLKWNLSMTGNLRCFKLYRTHVKERNEISEDNSQWQSVSLYIARQYDL